MSPSFFLDGPTQVGGTMEISRFQRKILKKLQLWQRSEGIKRKSLYRHLAVFVLMILFLFAAFFLAMSSIPEGDPEFYALSLMLLALALPLWGAFALNAFFFLVMVHFWPVLSKIVNWEQVDSILESGGPGR